MARTLFLVGVAVILVACAGRTSAPDSTPSVAAAPPCTAPVTTNDTPWREVRAAGFTFCVPVSWRPQGAAPSAALDAHTWRSTLGSITWGTGAPPTRRVLATETVVVRAGDPLPQPTALADTRRYSELIDGRRAEITEMHFQDLHHTEASWRDPAVYLQGETRSGTTAQILLTIHGTVRFTPGPASP
jgi:hypothetical protein